ncbi:MAG: endonuclease MutS2 [Clostridiales bacterium]|nr:endonuclease MutS2 [Clostridiales bacterium]
MYRYSTFEEEERRKQIRGRVLSVLEFDKVKEMLLDCTRTSYGKKVAEELFPTTDETKVKDGLEDTEEAFTYINKYGSLPLSGFGDIKPSISFTRAGGVLTMRQLLDVASFLRSVARLSAVISNEHSDMEGTNLFGSIGALSTVPALEKDISASIVNEDEMNDRASDTLYSIRREKKEIQQNIRVMLDRVIRNNEDILQEGIITIRGDRYCVPVRAECKSRLPGIVHDTSSTGQTVFIEPMAVVEANNRIRELVALEREEIARILEELTRRVLRESDSLESDIVLVGDIDFVSAKAELAIKMRATKPALNNKSYVRLVKARHPFIPNDRVVPIDIEIGKDYRSLIITGPNTGGKTVSLKTTGLFTLMAMAGLMLPCDTGSEIACFDRVLADIGDEQSIEQSLSTFSAHMSNIVFILKNTKKNSLVLLDELGSGTDPAEGAALAVAILDELFSRGCTTVATTHYKELKAYAIETEGVMNASCEFDTDTLSPTYRLIIGMPGVSNAFVISKKLGVPAKIIDAAMVNLSNDELAFERLLESAEESNREAKRLHEENRRLNEELQKEREGLEEEKKKLKASKTKILNDMRLEQKELLEEKEEELNELMRKIKKAGKQKDKRDAMDEMEKVRRRLRAGLKDLTDDSADDEILDKTTLPGEVPKEVKVGEKYYIPHLDMIGTCLSLPNKSGKVQIESGTMKLTMEKEALRLPTRDQIEPPKETKIRRDRPIDRNADSASRIALSKSSTTMPEIMLLGKRSDEAVSELERYIDDCSLSGIKTIRIVHGKGTGALRNAVDDFLRQSRRVKSHRLGRIGEGDDGVTIAELY